jgi:hypothetical protein
MNKKLVQSFFSRNNATAKYSGHSKTMYVHGENAETMFINQFGRHCIVPFKLVYV